jgi:hypothetical protein
LARSAVEHSGSWEDVASFLRIDPAQAENAYGKPSGTKQ